MRKWFRIAYFFSAWLFLLGILAQAFFAGLALFAREPWQTHTFWGWIVAHGLPALPLIFGIFSRLPRSTWLTLIILFVLAAIQPFLPELRRDFPLAAALHPVNAMLMFFLAWKVAVRARDFVAPPMGTGKEV